MSNFVCYLQFLTEWHLSKQQLGGRSIHIDLPQISCKRVLVNQTTLCDRVQQNIVQILFSMVNFTFSSVTSSTIKRAPALNIQRPLEYTPFTEGDLRVGPSHPVDTLTYFVDHQTFLK